MKTKQFPTYKHNRKIVMTYKERQTFLEDKAYYEAQGYPAAVAESRAYDHYHASQRAKLWN